MYCFSHAPQDSVSEGAYLSSVIFYAGPPIITRWPFYCLWWHCQSHDIIKGGISIAYYWLAWCYKICNAFVFTPTMQSVLVSICQICHGFLWLLYAHQELFDSARLSGWCCSCSKSIILFLRGSAGAVKIRWVFIDWRQEATYQLSLFLRAITLNCDLQIFLHSTSLEKCQSRCQSRCKSMLILMTWLTTWLMTYPH